MKKVCMIVPNPMVKGGIAAVVNGYRGSKLEEDYEVIYIESYIDGNRIQKLIKGIKGYIQFIKVLLTNKPALVHIHSSFGASFYRKLPYIYISYIFEIPIINHIHGADFKKFYIDANIFKKCIVKKVYQKCDKIIALSSEWKKQLSLIVSVEKIEVIENYSVLHEDALEQKRKRACNNTVLFLGQIGKRKGCYDIPIVVKQVLNVIPDVKFIVGGVGSKYDELIVKKMCEENGISANVEFPGWVRDEQKDIIFRNADVFFLPSYNEGMPMSVLDAMGYALPIVSTRVGGIPKIVHDGENGFCCNVGDIDAYCSGIIELLVNNDMRIKAENASVEIIKTGYLLDYHVRQLEHLYERVLN